MNELQQSHNMANRIQKRWKKHNCIKELVKIFDCINSKLTPSNLQELSDWCYAIQQECTGDGAGLSGGYLIDMVISKYFSKNLEEYYVESHSGESDMKIHNINLSLKKISGKSTIALNWSKNKTENKNKEYFNTHIMIINLYTEKWWKSSPKKIISNKNINFSQEIKMGIYLIDKKFCKKYIELSSNNKTNSLIESHYLYWMIQRSMRLGMFLELPTPNENMKFNICNAFSK